MVILATSKHAVHMQVITQLSKSQTNMKIASLSRYDDEMEELKSAGVHVVFNLYAEAGAGYADHIAQELKV